MKNKFLWINAGIAALCALIIGFLALEFVAGMTGYGFLQAFEVLRYIDDVTILFIYLAPLFILIFGILLLAAAAVNLLGELKVIKCAKLLKVFKIVKVALAGVIVFVALLTLIFTLVNEAALNVGFILIMVLALAGLAGAILDLVWKRK